MRDPLNVEELQDAENFIISRAQQEAFPAEYQLVSKGKPVPMDSQLIGLSPRLDSQGVLRCDGRTMYADWLPYDTRYPIILPRTSGVTKLLIKHYHEQQHHGGTNQTLAAMSSKYWQGRRSHYGHYGLDRGTICSTKEKKKKTLAQLL